MTLIVGYTESEASRAALDFGLRLADQLGMQLVVVNAGPGSEHRSESELTQTQTEQLEQYLATFSVPTELRQYARGRSTTDEFQELVTELRPYMVIIGAAKRSGLSKFMMGSVADELLRVLPVPVLSVKVPPAPGKTTKQES